MNKIFADNQLKEDLEIADTFLSDLVEQSIVQEEGLDEVTSFEFDLFNPGGKKYSEDDQFSKLDIFKESWDVEDLDLLESEENVEEVEDSEDSDNEDLEEWLKWD